MAGYLLPGTATPDKVLTGTTFSAGSNFNAAGTMVDNGAKIYTPKAAAQNIVAGYHNGNGVVQGDPNLIPANIVAGTSIFGVAGTASTASGIRVETGWYTVPSTDMVTVTGLPFRPNYIILIYLDEVGGYYYRKLFTSNSLIDNYAWGVYYKGNYVVKYSDDWTITSDGFSTSVANSKGWEVHWIAFG